MIILFFSLHRSFEEWLGDEFYDNLLSAAYMINHLFESKIHVVYVKATKPIKRGEKVPLKVPALSLEEEEAEWKHKVALWLFNLTLAKPGKEIKPLRDRRIHAFIKGTFEKEISVKKRDIARLESTLLALTKQ